MRIHQSVLINSIRRLPLAVPVGCSIAFAACTEFPGTANNQHETKNQVATYIEQTQHKPGYQPVEANPDPTYEWFY